jgi:cytochrome c-type biogenesis protein CcmE
MTRRRRRLYFVLGGTARLTVAVLLALNAMRDDLVFFYSPTELAQKRVAPGRTVRIGGLVEAGSVHRDKQTADGRLRTSFIVTDTAHSLPVHYAGALPDLFREGQGVVVEGKLGGDGTLVASQVLAKHDERYMPREVADALKRSGRWQEGAEAMPANAPSVPPAAGAAEAAR